MVSEKTPLDGSPEDAQRWRDAAASFAQEAPNRTLVTAKGSSHEVPTDRPDLVRSAVGFLRHRLAENSPTNPHPPHPRLQLHFAVAHLPVQRVGSRRSDADENLIRTRTWWLELSEPHHRRAAVAVVLKALHEAYSFEISVA